MISTLILSILINLLLSWLLFLPGALYHFSDILVQYYKSVMPTKSQAHTHTHTLRTVMDLQGNFATQPAQGSHGRLCWKNRNSCEVDEGWSNGKGIAHGLEFKVSQSYPRLPTSTGMPQLLLLLLLLLHLQFNNNAR